jgi:hypothetical protein
MHYKTQVYPALFSFLIFINILFISHLSYDLDKIRNKINEVF